MNFSDRKNIVLSIVFYKEGAFASRVSHVSESRGAYPETSGDPTSCKFTFESV